jgi:hypothetical protein
VQTKDLPTRFSLYQFFHHIRNQEKSSQTEIVPHYVGGSRQPVFPITKNYARVELVKHKPWCVSHQLSSDYENINEFTTCLQDPKCPTSAKLSYEPAKLINQQMTRNFQEVI